MARRSSRSSRSRNLEERAGDIAVGHRIEARVGAEGLELPAVVAPEGPDVELLGPALLVIHQGPLVEHSRLEERYLVRFQSGPHANLLEDYVDLVLRAFFSEDRFHPMVREPAAHLVEVVVAFSERLEVGRHIADLHVGRLGQAIHPSVERGGSSTAMPLSGRKAGRT